MQVFPCFYYHLTFTTSLKVEEFHMKVPEPHGRAGPCCPGPQAHHQCQGPRRRGTTTQYIFPAQALLQGPFLGSGNPHLMAKSFQEGHTARLVHTVHANIHSTGAAWGGRHSQQKIAGSQPWSHPVHRGAYAPLRYIRVE